MASKFIKRITSRDGEFLKSLAQTGSSSRRIGEEYYGLNEKRLRKLERSGYITSHVVTSQQQPVRIYKLDDTGREWIKDNTDIEHFYRSNDRQIDHDLALSEIYAQSPQEWQGNWLNENSIAKNWDNLSNSAPKTGTVDAMVTVNDVRIAIEVTTDNYGKEEIEEKEEISQQLQCERMVMYES